MPKLKTVFREGRASVFEGETMGDIFRSLGIVIGGALVAFPFIGLLSSLIMWEMFVGGVGFRMIGLGITIFLASALEKPRTE